MTLIMLFKFQIFQAMDRSMRIYDIYCRHVFPYATLSAEEKKQLEDEVKAIYDLQVVEDDAVIRVKFIVKGFEWIMFPLGLVGFGCGWLVIEHLSS